MLDLSHIPNSQQDIKFFYASGSAWQTWQKPRKCNYVYIMCIGGGSGGQGGGNNGPEGVGAGVGGGSGAITKVLYNSQLLPDTLYIQVGLGGIGGTSPFFPSSGTRSIVALQPTVAPQNLVAISGNVAANTPNGETVSTQATSTFYTLGNFISINGQTNNGGDITPLSSTVVSAGASGANGGGFDSGIGSSILSSQLTPKINGGGYAIDGSNGGNGEDGITSFKPFFSTGGAGGGASDSNTIGNGGNGGKGGIGSGGGSGGSANTDLGGTLGKGGDGGDGLVIIISF